ncbi:MAG TPA: hypothetical protein VFS20_28455 [Longimicrobium sp.]|nr:hypothetical protein [Longimicrobium sp.]
MPRRWCWITPLVLLSITPLAARGQAGVACADSARADTAGAVVVIRASVQMDEVTFRSEPRATARVPGCDGPPVRVLERRNLPERVQAGATYRDVYIAVEIVGRLEAQCIAALAQGGGLETVLGGACGTAARADTSRRAAPP